jgi:hypothetical protein
MLRSLVAHKTGRWRMEDGLVVGGVEQLRVAEEREKEKSKREGSRENINIQRKERPQKRRKRIHRVSRPHQLGT